MGDKVYKPIVKEGDHLIRSKDNPDRVRGLTRDENNQNPDIIEWEEYDVEDLRSDDYEPQSYEEQQIQLTPEQEEFAQQVGEAFGDILVTGGMLLFDRVISPWWKNTAWPWLKEKGCNIKDKVSGRKNVMAIKIDTAKETMHDKQLAEVSLQIDKAFEQFYFEMDEDEAKAHKLSKHNEEHDPRYNKPCKHKSGLRLYGSVCKIIDKTVNGKICCEEVKRPVKPLFIFGTGFFPYIKIFFFKAEQAENEKRYHDNRQNLIRESIFCPCPIRPMYKCYQYDHQRHTGEPL